VSIPTGSRIALAIVTVALLGASLTGCARSALASQNAPAAGSSVSSAATATPAPTGGPSTVSVQDIQNDLNSADTATANADGDVADADSSAATSDSP
jgi:ABC-type oligopeptide transport system substrate-binding subunit